MMKRLLSAGFLLLIGLPIMAMAQPAHLMGFKILQQANTGIIRVVFELDQKAQYHYFGLSNPHRLVVDFSNTSALVNVQQSNVMTTAIEDIRAAKKTDGSYRIVFDLKNDLMLKRVELTPTSRYKQRIALDLYGTRPTLTPTKPVITEQQTTTLRQVLVVIDPGHGGKDPGAMGPGGSHEKDVVLAIAKDLAAALNTQPGIKVYLTRKDDRYITLRQRLRIARRDKADIFIAIHADAYRNSFSQGASVYALSLGGASSEAARWLAAEENYSELGGVDLKDKNDMLRSVLINLSQTATIAASLQLGGDLLAQLNKFTPLHHDTVEQAPFVVLKSPDIPSVLIETGFLSNPKEEHLLCSSVYQHQLANSIMKGIYKYFYQSPPPGTIIAWQVTNGKKGETT